MLKPFLFFLKKIKVCSLGFLVCFFRFFFGGGGAVLDLSCSLQHQWSWHEGSSVFTVACELLVAACGI